MEWARARRVSMALGAMGVLLALGMAPVISAAEAGVQVQIRIGPQAPRAWDAWKDHSEYVKAFNPNNMKTFRGTILGVGTFLPEPYAAPGLMLTIRGEDGYVHTVYAGPWRFAQDKGFTFRTGDRVRVTGSAIELGCRNVLIASKIKRGHDTLKLRSDEGKPRWDVKKLR